MNDRKEINISQNNNGLILVTPGKIIGQAVLDTQLEYWNNNIQLRHMAGEQKYAFFTV